MNTARLKRTAIRPHHGREARRQMTVIHSGPRRSVHQPDKGPARNSVSAEQPRVSARTHIRSWGQLLLHISTRLWSSQIPSSLVDTMEERVPDWCKRYYCPVSIMINKRHHAKGSWTYPYIRVLNITVSALGDLMRILNTPISDSCFVFAVVVGALTSWTSPRFSPLCVWRIS